MDKIQTLALGPLVTPEVRYEKIGEAVIMIKPILPYEDVLDMIQWCVNLIVDERPFVSEPLHQVVKNMALVKYYTNLNSADILDEPTFSLKELFERYDILISHEVFDRIRNFIDKKQLDFFENTLEKTMQNIVAYRNSAQGILDTLAESAELKDQIFNKNLSDLSDPKKVGQFQKLVEALEKVKTPQK